MVNNFIKIKSLMSFYEDDFYFIQIIKRRKDNPDMIKGQVVIKNYYINSFDDFDKIMPLLKSTCSLENARGYFRLNKRNYSHLGLKVLHRALRYIENKNYKSLVNVFDVVAGKYHNDSTQKWIVDIDIDMFDIHPRFGFITDSDSGIKMIQGESRISKLISFLQELQSQTKNEPMIEFLPTKTGVHIITRPFNLQKFKKEYPNIMVHKDAPTLLYCP